MRPCALPLTRITRWLLWIEAGLAAAMLLMLGLHMAGVVNALWTEDVAEPAVAQFAFWLLSVILLVLFPVRGFFCLRWMWRANKNAHALSSGLETSPGWAWGAFFIPFWNLVKPFETMSEIWRSAESPTGWRGLATPPAVWLWWGLWIGCGVLATINRIAGQLGKPGVGPQPDIIPPFVTVGVAIALNLVFAWMIDHVAKRQLHARNDSVFE